MSMGLCYFARLLLVFVVLFAFVSEDALAVDAVLSDNSITIINGEAPGVFVSLADGWKFDTSVWKHEFSGDAAGNCYGVAGYVNSGQTMFVPYSDGVQPGSMLVISGVRLVDDGSNGRVPSATAAIAVNNATILTDAVLAEEVR